MRASERDESIRPFTSPFLNDLFDQAQEEINQWIASRDPHELQGGWYGKAESLREELATLIPEQVDGYVIHHFPRGGDDLWVVENPETGRLYATLIDPTEHRDPRQSALDTATEAEAAAIFGFLLTTSCD